MHACGSAGDAYRSSRRFTIFGFVAGAGLLDLGLRLWEVMLCILVGTVVLLVCLNANALAGLDYAIPFPVLCRASFGVRGAQGATLSRAAVGIGWLSLNLWLGSQALYTCTVRLFPGVGRTAGLPTGVDGASLGFFLGFVLLHVLLVAMGLRRLNTFMRVAAALQIAGFIAMLGWALSVASARDISAGMDALQREAAQDATAPHSLLIPMGITSVISGWSTLTLNIADLSRYAANSRSFMVC